MFRGIYVFTALAILSSQSIWGQTSYSFAPDQPLLDSAFYAGEAIDGSDVSGRHAWFYMLPSNDGKTIAFLGLNDATMDDDAFLVDVGDPSSWRRVIPDNTDDGVPGYPFAWTPDDSALIWNGPNGEPQRVSVQNGTVEPLNFAAPLPENFTMYSSTTLPSQNWLVCRDSGVTNRRLWLLPITRSGRADNNREPVLIADFTDDLSINGLTYWPRISSDGTKVAFGTLSAPPLPNPTIGKVYIINDISSIIAAPRVAGTQISTLAPLTLADPRVIDIAANQTANYIGIGSFSEDTSIFFTEEDLNNVFNYQDVFGTGELGDWRIVVSNSDGTGVPNLIPGPNAVLLHPFRGGTRVTYSELVGGQFEGKITSLVITNPVNGTTVGAPADNIIQTTSPQNIADASNTLVTIPTGTTVDFPDGGPQEISIFTPINPVTQPQLPPDVDAIPVVRDFGPDGTTFSPPIEITLSYTDAEIDGMDESSLTPFKYNSGSGLFDIPIDEADIVLRDPANNRIVFRVSSFSVYGLGGLVVTLPAYSAMGIFVLLITMALLAGILATRRLRAAKS